MDMTRSIPVRRKKTQVVPVDSVPEHFPHERGVPPDHQGLQSSADSGGWEVKTACTSCQPIGRTDSKGEKKGDAPWRNKNNGRRLFELRASGPVRKTRDSASRRART